MRMIVLGLLLATTTWSTSIAEPIAEPITEAGSRRVCDIVELRPTNPSDTVMSTSDGRLDFIPSRVLDTAITTGRSTRYASCSGLLLTTQLAYEWNRENPGNLEPAVIEHDGHFFHILVWKHAGRLT